MTKRNAEVTIIGEIAEDPMTNEEWERFMLAQDCETCEHRECFDCPKNSPIDDN